MVAVSNTGQKTDRAIFAFIAPDHPFYQQISDFEQIIQQSNAYSEWLERQEQGVGSTVHAEIKTKIVDGVRRLDRFYFSIQFPKQELPGGLYAWSLHYSAKDEMTKAYEFPADPKLAHLADFINAPENKDIKLLRYVPLRRVTFLKPGQHQQAGLIGKLKKLNRAMEGYLRLAEVASVGSSCEFAIPRAISIDSDHAVFYQTLLPGEEITYLLTEVNYLDLLFDTGKLHGNLAKLPLANDKRWDRDGIPKNLQNDLAEIIFYLPETARFIDKVRRWLSEQQKNLIQFSDNFCHGDFACSQILKHRDGWSIVDFDLAGIGNPYQDTAMFVASLGHDVPLFAEQPQLISAAMLAYLDGYEDAAAQSIDPFTFTWYLVCAEIYYLALILKKDRFSQSAYDHAQERINHLLQQDYDN